MRECLVVLVAENGDGHFIRQALQASAISDSIHFVSDGKSAIDYLSGVGQYSDRAAHPLPHFAFFNLALPDVSGVEVLKWMRRERRWRHTPVMLMGSHGDDEALHRARELDVNALVIKPPTIEEMAKEFKKFYVFWWPIASSRKFAGTGDLQS